MIITCVVCLGGCASYQPCPTQIVNSNLPDHACRLDGCTLAPDFNFPACCDAHDIEYWQGGSAAERLAADHNFRQCIVESGHKRLASVYYLGVRLGGVSWLPTPWRWGFGWDFPHAGARTGDNDETEAKGLSPQNPFAHNGR